MEIIDTAAMSLLELNFCLFNFILLGCILSGNFTYLFVLCDFPFVVCVCVSRDLLNPRLVYNIIGCVKNN